jgi:hypothetical protein
MDELLQLVQIINKHKTKSIEIIGIASSSTSKAQKLYELIAEGIVTNDNDAARHMYGTDENDRRYKDLKNRLRDRLINTTFFIDVRETKFNSYQKAYYNTWKSLAAAKILLGKSGHLVGTKLMKESLRTAEKFELTEVGLYAARQLRAHYGGRVGDSRAFEKYNELFLRFEDMFRCENLADEYYTRVTLDYIQQRSDQDKIAEIAKLYSLEIEPFLSKYSSHRLHIHGRFLQIYANSGARGNVQKVLSICDDAISFFDNKSFPIPSATLAFLHQKIVCCIQLKLFEEGKEAILKTNKMSSSGTLNWFLDHYYMVMLSFRCQNFEYAYKYFDIAYHHKNFTTLAQPYREGWKIAEAFLAFLIAAKHVNGKTEFKISKFINDVPTYSKDKSGTNVPILIIQILFLIQQGKYDEAQNRIAAIKRYSSRYLQQDESFRSKCFIKMLMQLPRGLFMREITEQHAKKYYQKLITISPESSNQNFEIEVIPYETLWAIILELLG